MRPTDVGSSRMSRILGSRTAGAGGGGSVEVELELEGAAVLEVVEGAVEGSALRARRLRVERVGARVELRALLRVRQHLRATYELRVTALHPPRPSARVPE